jgi:hypothetical protein
MMRAIRRQGWIAKTAKKKDLAAIVGQSFAAGVGTYNNLRKEHEAGGGVVTTLDKQRAAEACSGIALGVMHQHLREVERLGLVIAATEDGYLNDMPTMIRKAVQSYCLNDPLPASWRIVDVEREFPEHGPCRPDLMVRDDFGLAVVDYKSKVYLAPQYRSKTEMEYLNHDQMHHYAWSGEEVYGEPVQRYHIALSVFTPRFDAKLISQEINPETLKLWLTGRRKVWARMAEDDADGMPALAADHSDKFGQCEYYAACFRHRLDPELMKHDYINAKEAEVVSA